MAWIVIALVLLIAFGPVLWLLPSKRDKRLSALRARARQEGLVVEMKRLPKPTPELHERVTAGGVVKNPVIDCASYNQIFRRRLRYQPGWRLVRGDGEEDPFPGWRFDERPDGNSGRQFLADMLKATEQLVKNLPDDVIGLQVSPARVSVYWLENPGTNVDSVADLAALLRRFEADLLAVEDDIESRLEDEDS